MTNLTGDWGPCVLCDEPVGMLDGWVPLDGGDRIAHTQCMLRETLGGIGHLIAHEWWCTHMHDPDAGLTPWQSAQLVEAWVNVVGIERAEQETHHE